MEATMNAERILAGDLQGKMRRLSRRDLQLWLIALLVLLVIASGVVALVLPNLSWNSANLRVEMRYLPQVLFGLMAIVVLFNLYVLQQRRELNQAREDLMRQLLGRQNEETTTLVDPLTQLFNRRYLDHILPKEAYRAKRQQSCLTLLLVGVEELGAINRRHGGRLEDQCLMETARLLTSTFRLSDTVLRYSNDRFLVLMPDTMESQAEIAVERLLGEVEERNEKGRAPYRIVLNWSVAAYQEGAEMSDVLRLVEQSLHKQKKQQRKGQVLHAETCPQALLVCSDARVLAMLRPILDSLEIGVELSTQAEDGLLALEWHKLDALLLDCGEHNEHLELLKSIRHTARGRRLLLVAIVGPGGTEAAHRMGANFVLARPLNAEAVTRSLRVVHGLMVGEEQRFFRYEVETTVHMNFGQALLQAPVSHLSEGGMVVRTSAPLELNRKAALRFTLPGLTCPLEAQGEIAWVSPEGRAGIRFVNVPFASRHLIQRWFAQEMSQQGRRSAAPGHAAVKPKAVFRPAAAKDPVAKGAGMGVTGQVLLQPTAT